MQPPQPTVRQMSASDRYRRAVACLMNKADPLNDMTAEDKNRVLGIIADLEVADAAGRSAIHCEVFAERQEAAREYVAAVEEHNAAFLNAAAEHRVKFFDALRTEVKNIWAEKVRRAKARAADGPEADDVPAATVPGRGGPK